MEQGILIVINRANIPLLYLQEDFSRYAAIAAVKNNFSAGAICRVMFCGDSQDRRTFEKLCLLEVEREVC